MEPFCLLLPCPPANFVTLAVLGPHLLRVEQETGVMDLCDSSNEEDGVAVAGLSSSTPCSAAQAAQDCCQQRQHR